MPEMDDSMKRSGVGAARPDRFRAGRYSRNKRDRDPIFADNDVVDYKDIATLRRCLDERGRIQPRRKLRHSAATHRTVALAIKRARHLALLPFVLSDFCG